MQFVIVRDPQAQFRFAALTSDAAQSLLRESAVSAPIPDSIVLVEDGRVYFRSDAALRIARGLTFPWPLLGVFTIVPRVIRDWVYDFIAARRYQWFGRRDVCMVPTAELKDRFL